MMAQAFFDAGTVAQVSLVDGVHFDADRRGVLGMAIAAEVSKLFARECESAAAPGTGPIHRRSGPDIRAGVRPTRAGGRRAEALKMTAIRNSAPCLPGMPLETPTPAGKSVRGEYRAPGSS